MIAEVNDTFAAGIDAPGFGFIFGFGVDESGRELHTYIIIQPFRPLSSWTSHKMSYNFTS